MIGINSNPTIWFLECKFILMFQVFLVTGIFIALDISSISLSSLLPRFQKTKPTALKLFKEQRIIKATRKKENPYQYSKSRVSSICLLSLFFQGTFPLHSLARVNIFFCFGQEKIYGVEHHRFLFYSPMKRLDFNYFERQKI